MDKYLIKNTTRQQREQIVNESLGYSDIGCGGSGYMYDRYQAYIDGEVELADVNKQIRINYVSGEEAPTRNNCSWMR